MQIPIMIITPIIPKAFFKIMLQPITESTASPNILPTTGMKLDTAALVVLAVNPSTLLLKVPSKETTPTKIVSITPKTQTMLDLKNLESLSIWSLFEILETIPSAVETNTTGIIISFIKFPINVIINNKIGSNILLEAILPVVIINVIKIGISKLQKLTKLSTDSFTIFITSAKLFIIILVINMYWA